MLGPPNPNHARTGASASSPSLEKAAFLDRCKRLKNKDPYLETVNEDFFYRTPVNNNTRETTIRVLPEDYASFQEALVASTTLTEIHLDFAWFWEVENLRFPLAPAANHHPIGGAAVPLDLLMAAGGVDRGVTHAAAPLYGSYSRLAGAIATAIRQNSSLKTVRLYHMRGAESLQIILLACACSTSIEYLEIRPPQQLADPPNANQQQQLLDEIPLAGSEYLLDFAVTCPLRYLLKSTQSLRRLSIQSASVALLEDVKQGLASNRTLQQLQVQFVCPSGAQQQPPPQQPQHSSALMAGLLEAVGQHAHVQDFEVHLLPSHTESVLPHVVGERHVWKRALRSLPSAPYCLKRLTLTSVGPRTMAAALEGRVEHLILHDLWDEDQARPPRGVDPYWHKVTACLQSSSIKQLSVHGNVRRPPHYATAVLAKGLIRNTTLTHLHLEGMGFGMYSEWCQFWNTMLAANTTLESLEVIKCSTSSTDGFMAIVEGLVLNTGLQRVAWDVTLPSLVPMAYVPGVNVDNSHVLAPIGTLLTALGENQISSLTKLWLRVYTDRLEEDGDMDASQLESCLARNTSITELNLTVGGTYHLDDDLECLARAFGQNTRLETLRIHSNASARSGTGLTALLNALGSHPSLQTIALGFAVSGEVAKSSKEAMGNFLRDNESLLQFEVSGRLASADMASGLEHNRVLRSLTFLDVDENQLHEIGISLTKNVSVEFLEMRALNGTSGGALWDFLRLHLPNMRNLRSVKVNAAMSDEQWLPALSRNPRLGSVSPRKRGVGLSSALVDYYLRLNQCGRWLLECNDPSSTDTDVPVSLWPNLLGKITQQKDADCLYYMLRGKASLMEGAVVARSAKRKRSCETGETNCLN